MSDERRASKTPIQGVLRTACSSQEISRKADSLSRVNPDAARPSLHVAVKRANMIRKSGNRFSLGTNAKRLPGDHAPTKNASNASRGRIAWWPPTRLCQAKEALQRFVEQRRLLKIQNVARLRKHRQPRGRDGLFEEQARLDTRVVFIANDDQSRQRQAPDAIF